MDLQKTSKAIAGMLAAIVAAQLAKWLGSIYTPDVGEAIRVIMDILVTGVIGWMVVYFAPKNKE